jgi:pyruvate/2-oxoglutarate dehydrogenase complex dihydrolipoamide acyltransferase (E2) component
MRQEIKLPSLGDEKDAVQGGTVTFWLAEKDTWIDEDEDLLELTTDKAAFVVPSPLSGHLVERCVGEGDEVTVGETLCVMETL